MYYEKTNFETKKQDGTYEIWLKESLTVYDSANNIKLENLDFGEYHQNVTTVPGKIWSSAFFTTWNYQKDQYRVELTVKDMISGDSKTVTGYFKIATPPEEPGFEIAFAIAGLLVVAYLLRRRR